MFQFLQIFSNEAEEYLPDTLDIGDVPETIEPSTSSAPKQTNASTEASTSTSSRAPNAPSSWFDESLNVKFQKNIRQEIPD